MKFVLRIFFCFYKQGLEVIESTNLKYFTKEMTAEFYALKGMFLAQINKYVCYRGRGYEKTHPSIEGVRCNLKPM